ncbi:MAG: MATE family efflux transporter [Chitinophagales bacterium]
MEATYRDIWKLAYPIILASIAQTFISVSDTAFMGRVGEVELAAIGMVSVYYLILFMIGFSYTKGTQIMVARRVGEKKFKSAGFIFDHSMFSVLIIAVALFLIMRFGSTYAMELLVQDIHIQKAGTTYLEARSFGLLFSFTGSVFLAFYMGIGRTPFLLFNILVMSALNITLNYLLIFGKFGFPEMGISGAAWASNIAEAVALLMFAVHTVMAKLSKKYHLFKMRRVSVQLIKNITQLAFPIVLQTIISLSSWMIFFTFVEKMGAHEMAVSSVVKSIYMVIGIPAWGLSTTANTVISNLMGQNRQAEVTSALKKIIYMSLLFALLLALLCGFFPEICLAFYTNNPTVIAAGVPVLYVCLGALFVYSVSTVLYHGVISTGSTRASLFIELITVVIYLGFIISIFNIDGVSLPTVWISEIFYWFVLMVLTFIYLKTGHWKNIKI